MKVSAILVAATAAVAHAGAFNAQWNQNNTSIVTPTTSWTPPQTTLIPTGTGGVIPPGNNGTLPTTKPGAEPTNTPPAPTATGGNPPPGSGATANGVSAGALAIAGMAAVYLF